MSPRLFYNPSQPILTNNQHYGTYTCLAHQKILTCAWYPMYAPIASCFCYSLVRNWHWASELSTDAGVISGFMTRMTQVRLKTLEAVKRNWKAQEGGMYNKLRQEHDFFVTRDQKWYVMTNLDPEGLAARGGVGAKKVRQKKGHFSSKGPKPIALDTFSNLEHYFTFPALLSTFWAEFEHFFAFWAIFKHWDCFRNYADLTIEELDWIDLGFLS